MRIVWVGFHREGLSALEGLLEDGADISAVITLAPDERSKRSAAADYWALCSRYLVPLYTVRNINDPDAICLLRDLRPDVVFVIGWSQLVHTEALSVPRLGMIGAHASLLPHNRGSAPVNWALIRGEKTTGNTLLWLDEGVDSGDIIDQVEIPITPFDTCATLYERVAETNRTMILKAVEMLSTGGGRTGRKAVGGREPLPRRRPEDGLVDWTRPAGDVYNFIRALTRPYPGAFTYLDGQKVMIWSAALLPVKTRLGPPGGILGPVYSPKEEACGRLVACGAGAVVVLELETADGICSGRCLAEADGIARSFANE
ncbi:MAG: methionyl-tRNA formyltransferase [Armatimonadetes bacterium]|nr:methionyl-tRNA formyltransferase [Armatimonadota bacterium]